MKTTTTTEMLMWFHDATLDTNENDAGDSGFCECDKCWVNKLQELQELQELQRNRDEYWAEWRTRSQSHEYGLCMDCGIGLDSEDEFLIDRREKQCDCFTCDKCFETCFGKQALIEAVSWHSLGLIRPQHTRLCCCG